MKAKKQKTASAAGISKKEIRGKIEKSVNKAITDLHILSPSKKTKKSVKKASNKLAGTIKKDLKKIQGKKKQVRAVVKVIKNKTGTTAVS